MPKHIMLLWSCKFLKNVEVDTHTHLWSVLIFRNWTSDVLQCLKGDALDLSVACGMT